MSAESGPRLHRVLIDVDPRILVTSEEHQADLIREFQLISLGPVPGDAGGEPLPKRLADLIVEMLAGYQGTQEGNLASAHAALDRGDELVHLEMLLPVEAIGVVEAILGALEEADAYCREGDGLLTLATPPELAQVRRWFAEEVVRQIRASASESG